MTGPKRKQSGENLNMNDDERTRLRRRSGGGKDFDGDLGVDPLQNRGVFDPSKSDLRTGQSFDTEPETFLLCGECDVVYDHKVDWNNCPRCGDELREVEKA
jgi:hypothetical protein